MKAMILAAGRGSRMGKLGEIQPKCLLLAGDKTLIEHHLVKLAQAGVGDVVINVAHLSEQIIEFLGDGSRYGLNILYSREEVGAFETGGGVAHALPLLGDEPFILVSGDIYSDYDYRHLPQRLSGLLHLVLVNNPQFNLKGDFAINAEGALQNEGTPKFNYAGISVISPKLFAHCHEKYFPIVPLFRAAADNQQGSAEHYSGRWFNVGTEQLFQQLTEELARD